MPSPYTSPTKLSSSILIHLGDFRTNQADGGVVPSQFAETTDSVSVSSSQIQMPTGNPAFTHFDATVMQAANYDELIVDVGITATWTNNAFNASTSSSITDYSQIAATGRPFWLVVRCDGYGLTQAQASATIAINAALSVVTLLWEDMLKFKMTRNFKGFAFLRPDLNIVYKDGSAITRTQQSSLVQAAWNVNRAACFVTSRPYDAITLIAPIMTSNPNSGLALAHPILGCNSAQEDKVVIVYPVVQSSGQNISVVIGQVSATLSPTNRDPGYTPNLEFAYAIPINDSMWTVDGTGGLTGISGVEANLAAMANFVAAMGITQIGLFGVDTTALVSPFASGFSSPYGLAFDSSGNLYVANSAAGTISMITSLGVVSQYATGLSGPIGLAFDAEGNLYAANSGNNTVSKITGGVVSTFASGFNKPTGLAFDTSGNLYVANSNGGGVISMVTPGGAVSTYATVNSNSVNGLAFDNLDNLYIASYNNNSIIMVAPDGTQSTYATGLSGPYALLWNNGNLYVTCYGTQTVDEVAPGGFVSTFAVNFNSPSAIAVDSSGNFYLSNGLTGNVWKLVPTPFTSGDVPSPNIFLPTDANVNTSGECNTWGADGNVFVAYPNGQGGTTVRQFNSSFVETVPYTGPAYQ